MSDPDDLERLRAFDERLARMKKVQAPESNKVADGHEMAQHAWRMVTELVAGILIGFGVGFGLDTLFGTMPLFLVLFILLGLVAGIRVMMRSAQEVQRQSMKAAGQTAEDERD